MFARWFKILVIALLLPSFVINNTYPQLAKLRAQRAARKKAAARRRAKRRAAAKRKAAAAKKKAEEEAKAAKEEAARLAAEAKAKLEGIFKRNKVLDLAFPDPQVKDPITNKKELEKRAKEELDQMPTLPKIGRKPTPEDVVELYLEENPIKHVPANFFSSFPHLKELYLYKTQTETLDPKAFAGLKHLELLDISQNNIEKIPAALFENLPKLEEAIIGYNPAADAMERTKVEEIEALKKKYPDIRFTRRSPKVIKKHAERSNIRAGYLLKNQGLFHGELREKIKDFIRPAVNYQISKKEQEPFIEISRMLADIACEKGYIDLARKFAAYRPIGEWMLNLAHEDIRRMNRLPEEVHQMTADPRIDAPYQLGDFKVPFDPKKITLLTLPGNQLEEIPDNLLGQMFPNLKAINLSKNKITKIGANAFKGLPNLEYVFLSDNPRLSEVPASSFKDCKKLKLIMLNNTVMARRYGLPGAKGEQVTNNIEALMNLPSTPFVTFKPVSLRLLMQLAIILGVVGLAIVSVVYAPASFSILAILGLGGGGEISQEIVTEWVISLLGEPAIMKKFGEVISEILEERKQSSRGGIFKGGLERRTTKLFRTVKAGTLTKLGKDFGQEKELNLKNQLIESTTDIEKIAEELYYDTEAFKDVTAVQLEDNSITEIPANAFAQFPKVKTINLSSNLIKKIHPQAFNNLKDLRVLLLTDNEITEFPSSAINGCDQLQFIQIGQNPVSAGYNLWQGMYKKVKLQNPDASEEELEKIIIENFVDLNEKKIKITGIPDKIKNKIEDFDPKAKAKRLLEAYIDRKKEELKFYKGLLPDAAEAKIDAKIEQIKGRIPDAVRNFSLPVTAEDIQKAKKTLKEELDKRIEDCDEPLTPEEIDAHRKGMSEEAYQEEAGTQKPDDFSDAPEDEVTEDQLNEINQEADQMSDEEAEENLEGSPDIPTEEGATNILEADYPTVKEWHTAVQNLKLKLAKITENNEKRGIVATVGMSTTQLASIMDHFTAALLVLVVIAIGITQLFRVVKFVAKTDVFAKSIGRFGRKLGLKFSKETAEEIAQRAARESIQKALKEGLQEGAEIPPQQLDDAVKIYLKLGDEKQLDNVTQREAFLEALEQTQQLDIGKRIEFAKVFAASPDNRKIIREALEQTQDLDIGKRIEFAKLLTQESPDKRKIILETLEQAKDLDIGKRIEFAKLLTEASPENRNFLRAMATEDKELFINPPPDKDRATIIEEARPKPAETVESPQTPIVDEPTPESPIKPTEPVEQPKTPTVDEPTPEEPGLKTKPREGEIEPSGETVDADWADVPASPKKERIDQVGTGLSEDERFKFIDLPDEDISKLETLSREQLQQIAQLDADAIQRIGALNADEIKKVLNLPDESIKNLARLDYNTLKKFAQFEEAENLKKATDISVKYWESPSFKKLDEDEVRKLFAFDDKTIDNLMQFDKIADEATGETYLQKFLKLEQDELDYYRTLGNYIKRQDFLSADKERRDHLISARKQMFEKWTQANIDELTEKKLRGMQTEQHRQQLKIIKDKGKGPTAGEIESEIIKIMEVQQFNSTDMSRYIGLNDQSKLTYLQLRSPSERRAFDSLTPEERIFTNELKPEERSYYLAQGPIERNKFKNANSSEKLRLIEEWKKRPKDLPLLEEQLPDPLKGMDSEAFGQLPKEQRDELARRILSSEELKVSTNLSKRDQFIYLKLNPDERPNYIAFIDEVKKTSGKARTDAVRKKAFYGAASESQRDYFMKLTPDEQLAYIELPANVRDALVTRRPKVNPSSITRKEVSVLRGQSDDVIENFFKLTPEQRTQLNNLPTDEAKMAYLKLTPEQRTKIDAIPDDVERLTDYQERALKKDKSSLYDQWQANLQSQLDTSKINKELNNPEMMQKLDITPEDFTKLKDDPIALLSRLSGVDVDKNSSLDDVARAYKALKDKNIDDSYLIREVNGMFRTPEGRANMLALSQGRDATEALKITPEEGLVAQERVPQAIQKKLETPTPTRGALPASPAEIKKAGISEDAAEKLGIKAIDELDEVKDAWNYLTLEQQSKILADETLTPQARRTKAISEGTAREELLKNIGLKRQRANRLGIENIDEWTEIEEAWTALSPDERSSILTSETLTTPEARRKAAISLAEETTKVLPPEEVVPRKVLFSPDSVGMSSSDANRLGIKTVDDWEEIKDAWKALDAQQQSKILADETLTPEARRAQVKVDGGVGVSDEELAQATQLLKKIETEDAAKLQQYPEEPMTTAEELTFLRQLPENAKTTEVTKRITYLDTIDKASKASYDEVLDTLRSGGIKVTPEEEAAFKAYIRQIGRQEWDALTPEERIARLKVPERRILKPKDEPPRPKILIPEEITPIPEPPTPTGRRIIPIPIPIPLGPEEEAKPITPLLSIETCAEEVEKPIEPLLPIETCVGPITPLLPIEKCIEDPTVRRPTRRAGRRKRGYARQVAEEREQKGY